MKRIRKRMFAAALAAVVLITMPGTASYALEENGQTEYISDISTQPEEANVTEEPETETDDIEKPETEDSGTEEPKGETGDTEEKEPDTEETTEEEPDSISKENTEDTEQGDTGEGDAGTNLCAHHKEHTKDCGYSRASEDREGSPCTYECRICPIEDLIAALPSRVTADNAAMVRAQLNKILALFRELTEEEQAQIDLTLVYELQAALDEANAPMTADGHANQQEGDEASVDIGGDVSYYDTIMSAWAAAYLAGSAKVTLLTDATSIRTLYVESSQDIIFDGGEYTLSAGTAEYPETVFQVLGGKLTIAGGRIKTTLDLDGTSTPAVYINKGILEITGGSIEGAGCGLYAQAGTVHLSGGTFSGAPAIMGLGDNVGSFLLNHGTENGPHYAYYQDGIPLTSVLDQKKLTGPVTVAECKHEGVETISNDDGTHSVECSYCGYTNEAEDCDYGEEYEYNDANHWRTCTQCGGTKTEAHSWIFLKEGNGNVTTNYQECHYCGHTKDHVTVTIIAPTGLTYGQTEGKELTYTVSLEKECDKVVWKLPDENEHW